MGINGGPIFSFNRGGSIRGPLADQSTTTGFAFEGGGESQSWLKDRFGPQLADRPGVAVRTGQ